MLTKVNLFILTMVISYTNSLALPCKRKKINKKCHLMVVHRFTKKSK